MGASTKALALSPVPSLPTHTSSTVSPPASSASRSGPPRVDGGYLHIIALGGLTWTRVQRFDTPKPLGGFGGGLRVGEAVLPWMTLGLQLVGSLGYGVHRGALQRVGQGALLIDIGVLPIPKIPLSFRFGLGVGGGAVREENVGGRSGYGGAAFSGAIRYEFFPRAYRYRPNRGGGWMIAPEIGWLGLPPAAKGRPMANTLYVGFVFGFYFGS